ncbi:TIGR03564 family F420-dependent LLM class oxidoreductase [Saccharopolyspora gloriosae]|uniref:TIGR03564 family F420-dependent LLM class oxidoreductase n=1 Tax=Saccharopolyspora gloriosae TaxID=455344 RepID=UPI001FB650EE|nr:TIGR03564 family F420-dependent LLM class oxidoreductase [Saccharopolyspora gloriosae]
MELGVSLSTFAANSENVIDEAVRLAAQAADAGIDSVWFGQMLSYDAISVSATVGREVPGVRVGPSVVPIYPRHPQLLASAAKTAQAATGGRFRLGVGLGAKNMLEPAYGVPYPPPIKHLREYLGALRPLLDGRDDPFEGDTLVSRPSMPTAVPGAEAHIPVIVAAMGPQALRATGELADGTLPFLAGPKAIAEHIAPQINEAAQRAGRSAPQIVAAIPAVVTDDVDEARSRAQQQMSFYDAIPSYQRVIEQSGAEKAADLLLAGDEDTVAAGIREYAEAGATAVTLTQTDLTGDQDRLRTWQLLGTLKTANP